MAASYELMQSYAISKGVLSKDLTDAVLDPLQFFRIPHLLSLPAVAADEGSKLRMHMDKPASDPALSEPSAISSSAVLSYANSNPEREAVTIDSIFSRFRGMCKAVVDAHITADVSVGFRAASTATYVNNVVNTMLAFVDSMLPTATATTLSQHLTYVDDIIKQHVDEKVAADIQEWLVTPSLIAKVRACMEPYLRLKYIGANVRGPWNATLNASSIDNTRSFYEGRYSELVMFKSVLSMYNMLIDVRTAKAVSSASPPDTRVLYSVRDGYRSALELRMAAAEAVIAASHGDIATLSRVTRSGVAQLQKKSGDLEFRKGTLSSLVQSVASDEKKYNMQRGVFYAWLSAYIMIFVVSVALLVTGRNNTFIIMSAVVLLAMSVFVLARVVVRVIKGMS